MQAHQAPLILWDLGGQAGLRSIWDKYYAESHAILYVVDSSTAWAPSAGICEAPAGVSHDVKRSMSEPIPAVKLWCTGLS